jgi:hypothetical protein
MKTKFNIKITSNQIPRVKNKIQLEKKIVIKRIRIKFDIKIR